MTRMTVRMLYLSLAALLVLLAACGEDDFGSNPPTATPAPAATATTTPEPAPDPDPTVTTAPAGGELGGTEWFLTELDGDPALDDTRVSLEFLDEGVGGYSGCNWYGGGVNISDDSIRFDDLAMTLRLCAPEAINEQEQRFHALLREVERFEVTDGELSLLNAEGVATLVFAHREVAAMDPADLVGTSWQVVSFDDVQAGEVPGVLTFDDASSFSTRDGCYNSSGTYSASGDHLTFPSTDANAHTCLQPLEVQSHLASLSSAMGDVAYYRISDDGAELLLTHYDGRTATFARVTELPADDAWAVTWTLEAIIAGGVSEQVLEGTEITLIIPNSSLVLNESQRITGSSGCNTYQGDLVAGAETLTFSEISMTDMACLDVPGVMDQEQRYLELLGAVTSHSLYNEEGALQLSTGDGTILVFQPAE